MYAKYNLIQSFVDGKSKYVKEWLSNGVWLPIEKEILHFYSYCAVVEHHYGCFQYYVVTYKDVSKTVKTHKDKN